MEMIRTHNISRSFGKLKALEDISIHVNSGEIYGFLGLNGAGKTTLIRILLGMIKADEGEVFLLGSPIRSEFESWNDVGYLVETPLSYPNLSVYENLLLIFHLRKLGDKGTIDEIIHKLKLNRYRDTKAANLSLGNQQRLGLAKALIHSPRLLILDEPINGLDPAGIAEVRQLLKDLAKAGTAVFLSSHILSEISKLADRIGIIHQGKMVEELTSAELHAKLERKLIIRTNGAQADQALAYLESKDYPVELNEAGELIIRGFLEETEISKLNSQMVNAGFSPSKLLLYTEDLEEFFLRTIDSDHVQSH